MAITPLPSAPSRTEPSTFSSKADAFLGALPTFQSEANALATQVNTDAEATAADRIQTGLDAAATAADRIQTGLDAEATAADAIATAADRVQTGLDAASALSSKNIAQDLIDNISVAPLWVSGTDYSAYQVVTDPTNFKTYKATEEILNSTTQPNEDQTWQDISSSSFDPGATQTLTNKTIDFATNTLTGVASTSTTQVITNKILEKSSYTQIADATLGTGTYTFDYSQGDMQQLTATGDITIAFSNFVTGKVCTMLIDAVNWGDYTITHPAAMLFAAGTAPTYTAGGTDRLMVLKDKDDVYSLFIIGQAVAVAS